MLFSIITVSYNNKEHINKTLKSLLMQTYDDYELIIVDAKSTDGSKEEFELWKQKFKNYVFISEPDEGIYDAMNKGVKKSTGEYIYFLNLGDLFFNNDVLAKVAEYINLRRMDFYYGDIVWGQDIKKQPSYLSFFYFLNEHMICHQSVFAKKVLLESLPFDLTFKVCADRDWMIRSLRAGASYKKMNIIIACYNTDGLSSNYKNYDIDSLNATEKNFGICGVWFVKIKRLIGKLIGKKH